MSNETNYFHHGFWYYLLFGLLIFVVFMLIFTGIISIVAFTPFAILIILVACLIGSFINIPLFRIRSKTPMVREEYVRWFGIPYRVPRVSYEETSTKVAINVGGALIPISMSIYLLSISSASTILLSFAGVLIVTVVTYLVARPVKGVGIVTPGLVSAIAAAFTAVVLSPAQPEIIAYVGGTLGTLIGADLLNLGKIPELGAPVASIGGAGTFDGVFLTGIIAVIIATL